MTITIELKPEIETTATQQADKEGLPLSDYLSEVLEEAIAQRDINKSTITSELDNVYSKQSSKIDPVLEKIQAISLPAEEW